MRLALGFNPIYEPADILSLCIDAERFGYDSVWFHESLYQRDVTTYLAWLLGRTEKIKLGTGAINTFTRHPVLTACTFASLSRIGPKRVTLGFGLGSFPTIPKIGQSIFPTRETKPLTRVREYFTILRKLLNGEEVNCSGSFFTVRGIKLDFRPSSYIPIFIATLSPLTAEFAGEEADGVILSPAINTPLWTERIVKHVRKGEERKGRKIEIASYILTSISETREEALRNLKNYYFLPYQLAEVINEEDLFAYGVRKERFKEFKELWKRGMREKALEVLPEEAIECTTVASTAGLAVERINEYVKAGINLPIIMPVGDVRNTIRSLGSLCEAV